MNDTKSTKTLRLKKKSADTPRAPDENAPPARKRSGGRARQAALQDHARHARGTSDRHAANARPADTKPTKAPSTGTPPADASFDDAPAVDTPFPGARGPRGPRRHAPAGSSRAAREPERRRDRPAPPPGPDADPRPGPEPIARITRRPRRPRVRETFAVFAPCPHGLEAALAEELRALGYEAVKAGRAGCHFQADWPGILKANLHSRLATRILVQVARAEVRTEDDILALARETPWERWFGPEQSLRVDTSAIRSPMRSLQYCNLRAKDGICDRLREREGARPDIDTVRPDARVHLFLDTDYATLYLDVTGESLFKRGWRLDKGAAPLRENLAAGLLALSGWTPASALLDPFCGSGTVLIEAAWIALGVPPGIWRPFGFERLRPHDARLWRDLKDDARAHVAPRLEQPLVGADHDPQAIAAARANLARAHLGPEAIRFETCDARALEAPAASGHIVTNPPYGERLADDDTLWADWAAHLKHHFGGWHVAIISSDMALPRHLRLKARRRTPLRNGDLDCRLFQFELVSGGYRDKPSLFSTE